MYINSELIHLENYFVYIYTIEKKSFHLNRFFFLISDVSTPAVINSVVAIQFYIFSDLLCYVFFYIVA